MIVANWLRQASEEPSSLIAPSRAAEEVVLALERFDFL
jgi:hypothetical protein